MLNLNHKKLDVWKISIQLCITIYEVTTNFPYNERYVLISQVRIAAVSVSSNIAESASRSSTKERRRFYEISRSSLVEIDTQLEIARNINYLTASEEKVLGDVLNHLFALISNLIKSTK